MSQITIAQMWKHVRLLCAVNRIEINYGQPSRSEREIWIHPVRSQRRYATALHEIGYVLGSHQLSDAVLTREQWAWDWARRNALQWTPAMQRHLERCIESYKQHEEQTRPIGKPAGESKSEG
jgi:hypothetical protein